MWGFTYIAVAGVNNSKCSNHQCKNDEIGELTITSCNLLQFKKKGQWMFYTSSTPNNTNRTR